MQELNLHFRFGRGMTWRQYKTPKGQVDYLQRRYGTKGLATKLGVDPRTIRKWRSKQRTPNPASTAKINQLYGGAIVPGGTKVGKGDVWGMIVSEGQRQGFPAVVEAQLRPNDMSSNIQCYMQYRIGEDSYEHFVAFAGMLTIRHDILMPTTYQEILDATQSRVTHWLGSPIKDMTLTEWGVLIYRAE